MWFAYFFLFHIRLRVDSIHSKPKRVRVIGTAEKAQVILQFVGRGITLFRDRSTLRAGIEADKLLHNHGTNNLLVIILSLLSEMSIELTTFYMFLILCHMQNLHSTFGLLAAKQPSSSIITKQVISKYSV